MGSAVGFPTFHVKTEWMNVFKAMKLKHPEVVKLYELYNRVDTDNNGEIDIVELLTLLDIDRTTFSERVFLAFDKDHTGQIDFYEFVVSLWKFCTLSSSSISVFAFDLYDLDGDGYISTKQALQMFSELNGAKTPETDSTRAALLALTRKSENDLISIKSFKEFSKTHQVFLRTVFGIQNKLKISTLGAGYWEKIAKRRIQVGSGYNVPLSDLMVVHSNRKLFQKLLEDQTALRLDGMMKLVLKNTDNASSEHAPDEDDGFIRCLSGKIIQNAEQCVPFETSGLNECKKKKFMPKGTRAKDFLHRPF